jgi:hypothetical protein
MLAASQTKGAGMVGGEQRTTARSHGIDSFDFTKVESGIELNNTFVDVPSPFLPSSKT